MSLNIKDLQIKADLVFKRFRGKGHTFDQMMILREFLDELMDEYNWLEKKNAKFKSKEQKKDHEKETIAHALKMNNPLRDI